MNIQVKLHTYINFVSWFCACIWQFWVPLQLLWNWNGTGGCSPGRHCSLEACSEEREESCFFFYTNGIPGATVNEMTFVTAHNAAFSVPLCVCQGHPRPQDPLGPWPPVWLNQPIPNREWNFCCWHRWTGLFVQDASGEHNGTPAPPTHEYLTAASTQTFTTDHPGSQTAPQGSPRK